MNRSPGILLTPLTVSNISRDAVAINKSFAFINIKDNLFRIDNVIPNKHMCLEILD